MMDRVRGMLERLRSLVLRSRVERELDQELRFHLEREAEKLTAQGLSPTAARREAHRRFGAIEVAREAHRDARCTRLLEDTVQDVRYALRGLARDAGHAATAVLTLSVGIGATVGLFTLVDGVLLRPLPYPEPDRLVVLSDRLEDGRVLRTSYPNFADWRGARSFTGMAAVASPTPEVVSGSGEPARLRVLPVSRDFFEVAGVAPMMGRTFTVEEQTEGGPRALVVSATVWRDHLGGTRQLEGAVLRIDGEAVPVVGVMPDGFRLLADADVWTALDRFVPWNTRQNHVVRVVGRLAPGVAPQVAGAELDRIAAGILAAHPGESDVVAVAMEPLHDVIVGSARRPLVVLLAGAVLLLVIACTNLAGSLLARGTARRQELAVRTAMGAPRPRIVRQLLTESAVMAALGAAGGLLVAQGVVAGARRLGPATLPRLTEVGLDGRVLAATVLAAAAAVMLFAVLPALGTTAPSTSDALRDRTGTPGGRRARRGWRVLVAAEAALAAVLLAGCLLMVRSVGAILQDDTGFRTDGVVSVRLDLPFWKYPTFADGAAVLEDITTQVAALPGVTAVGLASSLPVPGGSTIGSPIVYEDGRRTEDWALYHVADADFFTTLDITLLEGRLFEPGDRAGAPHAAVVDATMARAFWPGESAVGKRFDISGMDPYPGEWLTVVGVVEEARPWNVAAGERPGYWVHAAQRPYFLSVTGIELVVHGTGDAAALIPSIRERIRAVEPDVPVRPATLEARLGESAADRRFAMLTMLFFAGSALLLAAMGVYGVVSYTVAQRRREIGIRLALGALPGNLRGALQLDAVLTVAAGAAVGLGAALWLSGSMASLLHDVPARDPLSYGAGFALLVTAGWLASLVPAHRTTRVDPVSTLRAD